MQQDRYSLLFRYTCLVGCLLGLAATLYFFAGASGYLASPFLNIATATVVLFAALFFLFRLFVLLPSKSLPGSFVWLLIVVILVIEVLLSLVPPAARDELTHHLAMPRLYARAGRILEIPFAPYSYYPALVDMLYIPFVRWGWDSIPKLIHGLFGFLTGLLLYAYLARRLSPIYGLLAFFFFISTPIILRLSNLAYVDLGLVYYSTASLLCLLQWIEGREVRNPQSFDRALTTRSAIRDQYYWLVLAGLSAGFAVATKPNGLLVVMLLFFLLAFLLPKLSNMKAAASSLLLFCLLVFLPVSPWLWKNAVQTGNPLFPFMAGLLGGGGAGNSEPSLGIFTVRKLLYGESWWQILALPLRVFFSGRDDSPQYFDGVLNPMLVFFLPWAFTGKWLSEKRVLFAFALLYFFYALFLVDLRIRYLLPVIPPLVILLVYGIHNVYLRMRRPPLLFAVMILLVALNGIYLWNYFHSVSPLEYLRGRESRGSYLARMLPEYPAIQYINQKLSSTSKIYFIFVGRRVYYSERDYFHDWSDNPRFLMKAIQGARNGREIQVALQQKGITHLLVQHDLFRRFLTNNLTPRELQMWEQFHERYLSTLFGFRGYGLYEIVR